MPAYKDIEAPDNEHPIGSFFRGLANARARSQFDEQAAFTSAMEAQTKLAQESRLWKSSANEEWGRIETMIADDNWDPAQVPAVLARAKNFDRNFGEFWDGEGAESYFANALHLGTKTADSGPLALGPVPGKPTMVKNAQQEVGSNLAGFVGQEHKAKYEQRYIDREKKKFWDEAGGGIKSDAMAWLTKNAGLPGGGVDADLAPTALLAYRAMLEGEGAPMELVDNALKEIDDWVAIQRADAATARGQGKAYRENQEQNGRELSSWLSGLRTSLGKNVGDDFMAPGGPGSPGGGGRSAEQLEGLIMMAEITGQRMVSQNYDLGTIKIALSGMFSEAGGGWTRGAPTPWLGQLRADLGGMEGIPAGAAQKAAAIWQKFVENPEVAMQPWKFNPVWDDRDNSLHAIDLVNQQDQYLWGFADDTNPTLTEQERAGMVAKSVPGVQQQEQPAGAGGWPAPGSPLDKAGWGMMQAADVGSSIAAQTGPAPGLAATNQAVIDLAKMGLKIGKYGLEKLGSAPKEDKQ